MTDTIWSDISEFQVPVNNSYPYHVLCIRSNDGSYQDHHFDQNYAWCKSARASGKLALFMVYYFYRPGVDGAHVLMSRCGKPDPRMVVMIDVEGAGGQVSGNQSGAINAQYNELGHWLGDPKRVVGYGNTSDLNSLWPQKPQGLKLVIAAYGSNPSYPGKYAHQFSDRSNTAPFGPSDINSADGMSVNDLLAMYGFSGSHDAPPSDQMAGTSSGPHSKTAPDGTTDYWWKADGSLSLDAVMARRNSMSITSASITKRTGSADDVTNFNKYLGGGTSHPMPNGLVFFTDNG